MMAKKYCPIQTTVTASNGRKSKRCWSGCAWAMTDDEETEIFCAVMVMASMLADMQTQDEFVEPEPEAVVN